MLLLSLWGIISAQNAAVSSYLDPQLSGNADVRIREVRMPSAGHSIGTYWCTMGYWTTGSTHGYGGLQWTPDNSVGPKNYIYSQWNDYSTNAYNDPATQVTTFGGEGTGVKSINNDPLNQWETDYWHTTADRVWDEGNNTHFAYIVKNGKTGVWRHIMTWSTPETSLRFTGSYCFIEDWRGDGEYRESQLRKGWNRLASSQNWTPLTTYKYKINSGDIQPGGRSYNKRTNWCGGKKTDATGEFFYMGAGGSTACTNNDNTNYIIARTETTPQEEYGVHRISKLTAIPFDGNNKLAVLWSWDSTTVPQFFYKITVKDGGTTVLTVSDTIPQKRSDTLDISSLSPNTKLYTITLEIIDFFDGNAEPKTATFGNGSSGYILISNPKGGETYKRGDTIAVDWQSDITNDKCKVFLLSSMGFDSLGITDITNGTFNLIVPQDVSNGDYRVVVIAEKADTVTDTSSSFSVFVPDSTNLVLDGSLITSVITSSSQSGEGIDKAFDDDTSTFWHTQYSPSTDVYPHVVVVTFNKIYSLKEFSYLPRQDGGSNGNIKTYTLEVSRDSAIWNTVLDESFQSDNSGKSVSFSPAVGKYVRITATSEINGNEWANACEFDFRYDATWIDDGTNALKNKTTSSLNNVSVNRIGNNVIIKCADYKNGWNLSLFSLNGKLLYSQSNIDISELMLDNHILGISSGVYIFRINRNNTLVNFK